MKIGTVRVIYDEKISEEFTRKAFRGFYEENISRTLRGLHEETFSRKLHRIYEDLFSRILRVSNDAYSAWFLRGKPASDLQGKAAKNLRRNINFVFTRK